MGFHDERLRDRASQDPLIIARMLVVGRQCLDDMVNKFAAAAIEMEQKIIDSRTRGPR